MFPTPATRFWSSRKALTGARLARASARRWAVVKSGLNGSSPSRAVKNASSAAWPSASSPVPKRRGRVEQQRAGHAEVHEQEDVVLELPHQVLAAPRQSRDAPALDGRRQLGRRERLAPAGVVDRERAERPALDVGRQV